MRAKVSERLGRSVKSPQIARRRKAVRSPAPARRELSTFAEYQHVVEMTDERKQRIISLLGLVGEIGDLHSMVKKLLLQKDSPTYRVQLMEEFGDVLWYLTSLAALYRISLTDIARHNAEKATAFFSEGQRPDFDRAYPKDERFPRKFMVTFVEKALGQGVYVKVSVNGVAVGDALTDNADGDDGYRYHDVFHLAFAAVLGWSPVTRALLKIKRKSDPRVDEVQDGARAAIVEEAVSVFLFNQAPLRNWYKDSAAIDFSLIRFVKQLTSGLEVGSCTAKQWRSAIFQGYAAFEQLQNNRGGIIAVDLDERAVSYSAIAKGRKR